LLDEYDVYEQLLSYWHETMHDDVFLVMNDGWVEASRPRPAVEDKDRKLSETPDIVIGSGKNASRFKTDLIPPLLVIARYFPDEQANVHDLAAVAEEASRAVEEYEEEHAVEEGLLAEAMDDDKITKALAAARLKVAKREAADPEEVAALERVLGLYNAEAAAKKGVQDAQAELDLTTLKKYGDLTQDDVTALVIDAKWHATARSRVGSEVTSLTLALVERIRELGDRYAETLSSLESELSDASGRVAAHLLGLGIT
jgi:type I restriction enzyme M protein